MMRLIEKPNEKRLFYFDELVIGFLNPSVKENEKKNKVIIPFNNHTANTIKHLKKIKLFSIMWEITLKISRATEKVRRPPPPLRRD